MLRYVNRVIAALVVALVGCSSASAIELLLNPTLDLTVPYNPNPGNPTLLGPQPASWAVVGTRTVSGPYTDVLSSEPWAGPLPTPPTTGGTGNPFDTGTGCGGLDCAGFFKAFAGNPTTGDLVTGHLLQTVPASPGANYELTVWAGAEANYSGLIPGSPTETWLAIDFLGAGFVLLDSVELDLRANDLGVPNELPFGYRQFALSGIAPPDTLFAQVRFSMIDGFSNPAGGGQALVVDDFSLRFVPEPAMGLLVGVLLCLGYFRSVVIGTIRFNP